MSALSSSSVPAPASTTKPSILIIDAMEIRRASVSSLLQTWAVADNVKLCSASLEEARQLLEQDHSYRMLIFSIGGNSLSNAVAQIESIRAVAPKVPLVIMSDSSGTDNIILALHVGAVGYVHTGALLDVVLLALSFILKGGSYFPVEALRQMDMAPLPSLCPHGDGGRSSGSNNGGDVGHFNDPSHSALAYELDDLSSTLTERQKAVLECLLKGDPNKVIARRLGMSETTVKVHVRHIMRKLGASNRTHAAVLVCNARSLAEWPGSVEDSYTPLSIVAGASPAI